MFRKINPVLAESEEGIVVDLRNRNKMIYAENDHSMEIEIEDARSDGEHRVVLNLPNDLKWLSPFENVDLSQNKHDQIKKNIIEALKFLNIKYEFE